MKKLYFILVAISVMLCIGNHASYGQSVFYNAPQKNDSIMGSGITVGAYKEIRTDYFLQSGVPASADLSWHPTFKIQRSDLFVELRLEKPENGFTSNFNCVVGLKVTYYRWSPYETPQPTTNQVVVENVSLKVNYDKTKGAAYSEKDFFHKPWAHYAKVEVLSISNPSVVGNIAIVAGINQDRYKPINPSIAPGFETNYYEYLTASDEIKLKFKTNGLADAKEYDVEWLFVDAKYKLKADGTGVELDATASAPIITANNFRFDASRVTIIGSDYYVLTNTFEAGYIAYRVRAVGFDINSSGEVRRVPGNWSDIKLVTVSPAGGTGPMYEHEPVLNWQYVCDYAEEGKKKEVITYYDGSLRPRQVVTQSYNNKTGERFAVAQDKIYDYQGRVAVEVLPAVLTEARVKFYPNLSRIEDVNGEYPYTKAHFDIDKPGDACATITNPMKSTAGASRYYSDQHPFKSATITNFQNFVPMAGGFPFVQKEYTSDNTGRIARQSAPGNAHYLGSGHETEYYYLRPNQQELDRLFGSEVGYADHYQKNVVIDANGQASVSYLNAAGKVIATALAGRPAGSIELNTLPGAANSTYVEDSAITVDLSNSSELTYTPDGFINRYQFFVDKETDYKFYYSVNPQEYDNATCVPAGYCLDCVYDLEISILDKCDVEQLSYEGPNTPLKTTVGEKPTTENNRSACNNNASGSFDLADAFAGTTNGYLNVRLQRGTYTITKKLTVNKESLDYYTTKYMQEQTSGAGCKTLTDFVNEAQAAIDLSGCGLTCESCLENIGLTPANQNNQTAVDAARAAYISQYINEMVANNKVPTTEDEALAGEAFDFYKENCAELCLPDKSDMCEAMKKIMIRDVMPGGQYAKYIATTVNGQITYAADDDNGGDEYNILGDANGNSLSYQSSSYPSAFSNIPVEVLDNNGDLITKTLSTLTVDEFVKYFKEEWVEYLLPNHPEYCNYERCLAEKNSEDFTMEMLATQTYTEASAKNLLQPFYPDGLGGTISRDPFFNGTCGSNYFNDMKGDLDVYMETPQYRVYVAPNSLLHNSDIELIESLSGNVMTLYDKNNPTKIIGTITGYPANLSVKSTTGTVLGTYEVSKTADGKILRRIDKNYKYRYKMSDIPLMQLYCNAYGPNESRKLRSCVLNARSLINNNFYSCDDLRDRYWKEFRALYLSSKGYYTEKAKTINGTSCYCAPTIPGLTSTNEIYKREKRFYPKLNNAELFRDQNGALEDPSVYRIYDPALQSSKDKITSELVKECDENCNSYATYWLNKIEQCSTANRLLTEAEKTQLLDALKAVCNKGCDANNPMGSSTVSPVYENDPNVIDKNFHDVFSRLFGGIFEAGVCDELLIKVPKPYGHDYLSTSSPYKDTCSCNQSQFGSYNHLRSWERCNVAEELPPAESCPCSSAALPSQTQTNLRVGKGVSEDKKCKKCIGCLELSPIIFSFKSRYPNILETDALFQPLFENFANNNLNMNLHYSDYQSLISSCTNAQTFEGFLNYFDDIYLTSNETTVVSPYGVELWPVQYAPTMMAVAPVQQPNAIPTTFTYSADKVTLAWGRKLIPDVYLEEHSHEPLLVSQDAGFIGAKQMTNPMVAKTLALLSDANETMALATDPPPSGSDPNKCGCEKIFEIWKQNPAASDEQLSQLFATAYNGGQKLPNFSELKKQCCLSYNNKTEGIGPVEIPGGTGYVDDSGEDTDDGEVYTGLDVGKCSINFGANPSTWTPSWTAEQLQKLGYNFGKAGIQFPRLMKCQDPETSTVDGCGCDELKQYSLDFNALPQAARDQYGSLESYIQQRKGITTPMPNLATILSICEEIKGAETTWEQQTAATLEERMKMLGLKLPKEFACPPPSPYIPGPGGGGGGGGNSTIPGTITPVEPVGCLNDIYLSCADLREMLNNVYSLNYEYINDKQLAELKLIDDGNKWASLLEDFKTAISFPASSGCITKINFSQNVSQCGGERPVINVLNVKSNATDAELADLLSALLVWGCGCVPQPSWTRLSARTTEYCTSCYGATKELAGLQAFFNELANHTHLTTTINNTTYQFNAFYKGGSSVIPQNSAYATSVYDGANASNLTYSRSTAIPYLENAYRMVVSDGSTYNKTITLMFTHNTLSNRLYFVRRFFNIRPSCPNPQGNFEVDVELDLYDDATVTSGAPPIRMVTTIQGIVFGLPLGIEFNCCTKVCNRPAFSPLEGMQDECSQQLMAMAELNARKNYEQYMESKRQAFQNAYMAKCLTARNTEVFSMKYVPGEYHFTLYYYDQAGNLTQTVPPQGVVLLRGSTLAQAGTARKNTALAPVKATHNLVTSYQYNTLNQLVWQSTPDAGVSKFYYDALGRIVFSQNAKQSLYTNKTYSYTVYDALGRINEVGEVVTGTTITHAKSRDAAQVATILAQGTKSMITQTFYDDAKSGLSGVFAQDNLRTRVSYSSYRTYQAGSVEHETYYSYDVHGNVKKLGRQIQALSNNYMDQGLKVVDYYYDLISGKVNHVIYQQGEADQYIHSYKYDRENRLTMVFTGHRPEMLEPDAHYQYYLHGPLARTEFGAQLVQGADYAYTIQGWLKGVNSGTASIAKDMGMDGALYAAAPNDLHKNFGADAFGFILNYYQGDYSAVNNTSSLLTPYASGSTYQASLKGLYNGNISGMVTAIRQFMQNDKPLGSTYRYDQLNRLASATYYDNYDVTNNNWSATGAELVAYKNTFFYDANGNIITQQRNGSRRQGYSMDDLVYEYFPGTNRLKRVTDAVGSSAYMDDVDQQAADNYEYDAIGNLTKDKAEEIQEIQWNVYGKITRITRVAGSKRPDLQFEYTPDGHRAVKVVIPKDGSLIQYTYYVRDAQGNIMATYERKFDKIIDYSRLTYAEVNDKLAGYLGDAGFANAFSSMPGSTTNTGLLTAVLNSMLSNTATLEGKLKEMVCMPVEDLSKPYYLDWVHTQADNDVLLKTLLDDHVIDLRTYITEMVNCTSPNNPNLLALLARNPYYAQQFMQMLCDYDAHFGTHYANDVQNAYFGSVNCPLSGSELSLISKNIDPLTNRYNSNWNALLDAYKNASLDSDGLLAQMLSWIYYNGGKPEWNQMVITLLNSLPQQVNQAKIANACACGGFDLPTLIGNGDALQHFLIALRNIDETSYNNIFTNLSLSTDPANLKDIVDGNQFDPNDMRNAIENAGYASCSTAFKRVLEEMGLTSPANLSAFVQLSVAYGKYSPSCLPNVRNTFTCSATGYVKDLFLSEDYWNSLLTLSPAAYWAELMSTDYAEQFMIVAAKTERAAISAYQQANNMYSVSGNGMFEYFNHIKTYAGVSAYDYLVTYFMGTSNTYMDTLKVADWQLYGSSRLGNEVANRVVAAIKLDGLASGPLLTSQSYFSNSLYSPALDANRSTQYRGNKRYELSNHLGNVLVVVSDKKIPEYNNQQLYGYSAEVLYANDYSPFGAPMPDRSYDYRRYDAVMAELYENNMNLTGWQTIFCTNPNSCTSPESSVTLSLSSGKLRMQTNKRYSQAYYTFSTIPGRVYRVKYRLSASTISLLNVSVMAPVSKAELYTSANLTPVKVNGVEREMFFKATETNARFYLTKGWSATATTGVEEVTLDYLTIMEVPDQMNYISCASINENLAMLAAVGVNINDSNQVRNNLNAYYKRNYSYLTYATVLSGCANGTYQYVLPEAGAEASKVEDSYRFGFNGKENDNETYGTGNAVDFGARIYDSRLGRWLSTDPFQRKYPSLSPYIFSGNSPIIFADMDGRDFGVIINKATGTVLIMANVYTTDAIAYNQAIKASEELNGLASTTIIDGKEYVVKFDVNVVPPQTKEEINDPNHLNFAVDPIGNLYKGTVKTVYFNPENMEAVGGETYRGKYILMNNLRYGEDRGTAGIIPKLHNGGDNVSMVVHEFLHLFGLDDAGGSYYSEGGRMQYTASTSNNFTFKPISQNDVNDILRYAFDNDGKQNANDSKVTVSTVSVQEVNGKQVIMEEQ